MSIHVTFVNPVMDLIEDYDVDYALEVLGFFTAGGVPSLEDLTPDPQAAQRAKDYFLTVAPGDRKILEAMANSLNPHERYQIQRQISVATEAATQLCLELPHAHLEFLDIYFNAAHQHLR